MDKITKKIITTRVWALSTDLQPIDLPKEGLITEVRVRFDGTLTAAIAATAQVDGPKRVMQNFKLQGDGGRTYLGLSGVQMSRLLALLNEYEFGCPFLSPPYNIGATALQQSFIFHPGSNPADPFDLSAVIPARALSTLQALISTTANAVIDATGVIDPASTFEMEINEVLGVPVPAGIMTPLGSSRVLTPGAVTYSDHSLEVDVPAGAWLRRIIMLVQDDTAIPLRADDEVTSVRLKLPRTASFLIESDWEDLKVSTAKLHGYVGEMNPVVITTAEQYPPGMVGPVIPKGFVIIDLRKYFHPIWGANLTEYATGDVKLGLTSTTVADEDILIYWDQLMPVEPIYVGK